MRLIRFLLGTLTAAAAAFFFASWARREVESQIGRMQLNAYNSPGAESAVPPQVMASGISVLGGVWWAQRKLLRQTSGGAVFSMLLGVAAGVAALFYLSLDDQPD